MLILYGYILTLVVKFVSSGANDVTVRCGLNCKRDGSNFKGKEGERMGLIYVVTNEKIASLKVTFHKIVVKINKKLHRVENDESDRLSVTSNNNGNSIQANITIKNLMLKEDNGATISYTYQDEILIDYIKESILDVTAPTKFSKKPEGKYTIRAGESRRIKFSIRGNPKPAKVEAKIGSKTVNVIYTHSPSKYIYNYQAEITMEKKDCGESLKILVPTFESTIILQFEPDKVEDVLAVPYNNNLNVTWKGVKYGKCRTTYNVKKVVGGVQQIPQVIDKLVYIFSDAYGNNSISVNAEVNEQQGSYSDVVFVYIPRNGTAASGGLIDDEGVKVWLIIVVLILVALVVIVLCYIYFKTDIVKKWKQRKVERNSREEREERHHLARGERDEAANTYEDVSHIPKYHQQSPQQQLIYAELGPSGGRTGEKPVIQESNYATAKTEGVYYPDLQKSTHNPVVSSGGGRSQPSVSSDDYTPGVVV